MRNLVLLTGLLALLASGCGEAENGEMAEKKERKVLFYRDSMNPQYTSPTPG